MSTSLYRLIDRFAGRRILVIGEAMLDAYLKGTTNRLCPEAPVPVVALDQYHYAPGGAANSAVNVKYLGGEPAFVSLVGADAAGERLRAALEARGISTQHMLAPAGRRTLSKSRVIAGEHMLVRFDEGDTSPADDETEQCLIRRLTDLYPACEAVIISDYGYGVLTPRVIEAIQRLQQRWHRLLVVDSKRLPLYKSLAPTVVKPNYPEALRLLELKEREVTSQRASQLEKSGEQLLDLTGARLVIVTLDIDGALLFEQAAPPYRTYAQPASNTRAAGAGDTFVSALTLALAAGAESPAAAEIASAAAALVVHKEGTATCSAAELRGYVASDEKYMNELARLAARVEFYRASGRRIVFTNGCFDILHRGHTAYLNRAKQLGDVLIVGVNSDASIRRLKGPDRPINSLEDRVQVLSSLSCIDHLIAFDEPTPERIIRMLRPDVFAKGGDYSRETLPEAALVESLGGHVELLPYLEDHSTTSMIERIRGQQEPLSEANTPLQPRPRAFSPDGDREPAAIVLRGFE